MNKSDVITQKQEKRYKLLLELWESAKGREKHWVDFREIAAKCGLDEEESSEIFSYFNSEGFFEHKSFNGTVTLSHSAIVEVEKTLANPSHSTEHFSTTIIQNFNASVGAVQTGNNNVANVTQNIGNSNTNWIREHHAEYAGKYIALENGKLVGQGKNFPEALADAKKNGAENPFITYVFPPDSEPFGGW